ncbi:MAG: glutathione peroxidase [Acholeplasmatales bacterium]|nr:glutathione peroxidase [Acholeplasmatales bacterium]
MNIGDFKVLDKDLQEVSLSNYQGKVLLIVNTATKCGLTPQYEGLQELYIKYQAQGLEILDFPCNQFLHQAPGTNQDICEFRATKYQITFPQFNKINVNGAAADPLYKYLKTVFPGAIKWNFGKFLVDKTGQVVQRYSPIVKPQDLEADIVALLK